MYYVFLTICFSCSCFKYQKTIGMTSRLKNDESISSALWGFSVNPALMFGFYFSHYSLTMMVYEHCVFFKPLGGFTWLIEAPRHTQAPCDFFFARCFTLFFECLVRSHAPESLFSWACMLAMCDAPLGVCFSLIGSHPIGCFCLSVLSGHSVCALSFRTCVFWSFHSSGHFLPPCVGGHVDVWRHGAVPRTPQGSRSACDGGVGRSPGRVDGTF